MKSFLLSAVGAAAVILSVGAGDLHAQPALPGGGQPTPVYNPYLNLLRPGGTPAQNYFQLVSPELTWRQGQYNLQNQVAAGQQTLNDLRNEMGQQQAPTGHAAQFMNYRSYFMTNTGGGGGGKR